MHSVAGSFSSLVKPANQHESANQPVFSANASKKIVSSLEKQNSSLGSLISSVSKHSSQILCKSRAPNLLPTCSPATRLEAQNQHQATGNLTVAGPDETDNLSQCERPTLSSSMMSGIAESGVLQQLLRLRESLRVSPPIIRVPYPGSC